MKKKLLLLFALSTLALTSCTFNPFDLLGSIIYPQSEEAYSVDESGNINYSVDIIDHSSNELGKDEYIPKKEKVEYTYGDFISHNVYTIDGIPSKGDVNILVIPIWFANSSDHIRGGLLSKSQDQVREDIATAFFDRDSSGKERLASWRSVKRYYEEASFGNLHVDGVVTGWYSINKRASDISSNTSTVSLVKNAVDWAKNQYKDVDWTKFDADNNGYLDCVCLIYGYHNSSYKEGFAGFGRPTRSNDNLWAYTFWVQDTNKKNVSNPGPNTFLWASYDFMYGEYAGGTNTEDDKVDAHTFIHEIGHCFGLEDYYDYNNNNSSCRSGGFSMQDYNVGGHDPFSRLALGWVNPYVPTNDCKITLKPFESSGDLLLLSPNFVNSPFDEYVLLEYYTPTGLNAFDNAKPWSNGYPTGSASGGIRVWHVDSRLLEYKRYPSTVEVGYQIAKTINRNYYYLLGLSNTTYSRNYIDYCSPCPSLREFALLHQIRNSSTMGPRPADKEYMTSNDLFKAGSSFSINDFQKQFVNGNLLNNGQELPFTVTVESINDEGAALDIKLNLN